MRVCLRWRLLALRLAHGPTWRLSSTVGTVVLAVVLPLAQRPLLQLMLDLSLVLDILGVNVSHHRIQVLHGDG